MTDAVQPVRQAKNPNRIDNGRLYSFGMRYLRCTEITDSQMPSHPYKGNSKSKQVRKQTPKNRGFCIELSAGGFV